MGREEVRSTVAASGAAKDGRGRGTDPTAMEAASLMKIDQLRHLHHYQNIHSRHPVHSDKVPVIIPSTPTLSHTPCTSFGLRIDSCGPYAAPQSLGYSARPLALLLCPYLWHSHASQHLPSSTFTARHRAHPSPLPPFDFHADPRLRKPSGPTKLLVPLHVPTTCICTRPCSPPLPVTHPHCAVVCRDRFFFFTTDYVDEHWTRNFAAIKQTHTT